jgi:hypothetical protein
MFVTALAYACEQQSTAIFSTGVRASRKLLDIIFHFVQMLPDYDPSWIVQNNKEDLWLRCDGAEGITKISSYPSKAQVRPTMCECVRHWSPRPLRRRRRRR